MHWKILGNPCLHLDFPDLRLDSQALERLGGILDPQRHAKFVEASEQDKPEVLIIVCG
jgi:hypothetical protein